MAAAFKTETLIVGLGERSYPIISGAGILTDLGVVCRAASLGRTVAVVTNPTVGGLYFRAVREALSSSGFTVHLVEVPDGEEYKNLDTLKHIYGRLIDCGIDRGSAIVALGGGVVGDIAGFAAATFLRGIRFVQVPTTLLAQVDSSVGGKTGVNHEKGKNLIGAFYQPALVLIDIETLNTLPDREFLCGLAEVVKYGAVLDAEFFRYLETDREKILARYADALLSIARQCCRLKADVVEKDEKEGGLRAVLNYGHTIGHAVETLTNYNTFKHGEAVAIGMAQAARLAEFRNLCTSIDADRIRSLLASLGLPVQLPMFAASEYAEAILHDKKAGEGGVTFVLNKGIGDFCFSRENDIPALMEVCGIGG